MLSHLWTILAQTKRKPPDDTSFNLETLIPLAILLVLSGLSSILKNRQKKSPPKSTRPPSQPGSSQPTIRRPLPAYARKAQEKAQQRQVQPARTTQPAQPRTPAPTRQPQQVQTRTSRPAQVQQRQPTRPTRIPGRTSQTRTVQPPEYSSRADSEAPPEPRQPEIKIRKSSVPPPYITRERKTPETQIRSGGSAIAKRRQEIQRKVQKRKIILRQKTEQLKSVRTRLPGGEEEPEVEVLKGQPGQIIGKDRLVQAIIYSEIIGKPLATREPFAFQF